jgi:hypothetical protein
MRLAIFTSCGVAGDIRDESFQSAGHLAFIFHHGLIEPDKCFGEMRPDLHGPDTVWTKTQRFIVKRNKPFNRRVGL